VRAAHTGSSMLKRNGLIEVTGAEVKASDNLFIETPQ
jgi:hypothetical protein